MPVREAHHRERRAAPFEAAFTLIEVTIVVALVVTLYAVALPRLNLASGAETSSKMGQLAIDVRSAYDMAVLSGYPHRLVFELGSGNYWLERAGSVNAPIGDDRFDRDPTEEEVATEKEAFEDRFRQYEDLAGDEFRDPDTGDSVRPPSPVVEAKDRLKPVAWEIVDSMEWKKRTIGPYMIIKDMQAEHHRMMQRLEELGPRGRVMLYFLPAGQVERAVFHISMRKGDAEADPNQTPFTLVTLPFEGVADVSSGYTEVDVHED